MKAAVFDARYQLVQELRIQERMEKEARVSIAYHPGRARGVQYGLRDRIVDGNIAQIFGNDILAIEIDGRIWEIQVGSQMVPHQPALKRRVKKAVHDAV